MLVVPAMDQIFQAMAGKRVFQSFGFEKDADENEIPNVAEIYDVEEQFTVWKWQNGYNWFNTKGNFEAITDYQPSDYEILWSKKLIT